MARENGRAASSKWNLLGKTYAAAYWGVMVSDDPSNYIEFPHKLSNEERLTSAELKMAPRYFLRGDKEAGAEESERGNDRSRAVTLKEDVWCFRIPEIPISGSMINNLCGRFDWRGDSPAFWL